MDKEKIFSFTDKLLEPSTIKGIVALIGAVLIFFMTPEAVDNWGTKITNLLVALYGVYQIFRNETSQVIKVAEKMKAAGMLSIIMLLIIPVAMVQADPFLCVDAQDDIASYSLQIDGGAIIDDFPFTEWTYGETLTHCLYDVGALGAGEHTFLIMPVGSSGWEGDWSVPFSARKPGGVTGIRIRKSGE